MAGVEGNHIPVGNSFPRPIPHQPRNHVPQNALLAGQLDGHREDPDIPQAVWGVHRPHWHDPHHVDLAHHGMVNYPPRDPIPYVFPDMAVAQGIPAQGQPILPGNQEHILMGNAPQHVPLFPPQAAFPDPFAAQIPAPGQPATENLRRLAIRYLHHPDSEVGLVSMEPGAAGRCKVVIILEMGDVF